MTDRVSEYLTVAENFKESVSTAPTELDGTGFWKLVETDERVYRDFLTYVANLYATKRNGLSTANEDVFVIPIGQQDCSRFLKLVEAVARDGVSNLLNNPSLVGGTKEEKIQGWADLQLIPRLMGGWEAVRILYEKAYGETPEVLLNDTNMIELYNSAMNVLEHGFYGEKGVLEHTRRNYPVVDLSGLHT